MKKSHHEALARVAEQAVRERKKLASHLVRAETKEREEGHVHLTILFRGDWAAGMLVPELDLEDQRDVDQLAEALSAFLREAERQAPWLQEVAP